MRGARLLTRYFWRKSAKKKLKDVLARFGAAGSRRCLRRPVFVNLPFSLSPTFLFPAEELGPSPASGSTSESILGEATAFPLAFPLAISEISPGFARPRESEAMQYLPSRHARGRRFASMALVDLFGRLCSCAALDQELCQAF